MNKIGRPRKYVCRDEFNEFRKEHDARWTNFICNHWSHLKRDVSWIKVIGVGIFIAVMAGLIVQFFG